MSYKITKATEAVAYQAPGHFDCRTTRLHTPDAVEGGLVINGLSHFLPGGGADVAPARAEMIYYVIEGEITLTIYDDNDIATEVILHKGDSVHFNKGTKRGCVNNGSVSAQMMTIMIKPSFYE